MMRLNEDDGISHTGTPSSANFRTGSSAARRGWPTAEKFHLEPIGGSS